MSINPGSDEGILIENEACYELVAGQEEIYLEETEEELRAILVFDAPSPTDDGGESPEQAAEELITGDSDDPPLSDEEVEEMVDERVSN